MTGYVNVDYTPARMAKQTSTQTYRVSDEVDTELRQLAKVHGGMDRALRFLLDEHNETKAAEAFAERAWISETPEYDDEPAARELVVELDNGDEQ